MTFLSRHNIPRSHATVLLVAVVLHLLHQLWFYEWFIEDAAITIDRHVANTPSDIDARRLLGRATSI